MLPDFLPLLQKHTYKDLPGLCKGGLSFFKVGLSVQDGQWKARLASMEGFMEWVKGTDDIPAETASLLVQGIAIVPGWSEKNFQVNLVIYQGCM